MICGLVAVALFIAPAAWVLIWRVSIIISQSEFLGYRFYTSLRVLTGENSPIVQGIPIGILHHTIVAVLVDVLGRSPLDVATFELFGYINLVIAWGMGAVVLCWWWRRDGVPLVVLLTLSIVSLVPWYGWPARGLFLSPDYWTYELPFAMLTAAWMVLEFSHPERRGPRFFVAAGVWLAIGATLKVTMAALAILPAGIAVLAILDGPSQRVFTGGVIYSLSAGFATFILIFVYFLGNWSHTIEAIGIFMVFIQNPGRLDFESLMDIATSTGTSFLRWTTVAWIITLVAALSTTGSVHDRKTRMRMGIIVGILALTGGHVYALHSRPSVTTVVDAGLFALFTMPLLVTMVPQKRRAWLTLAATSVPLVTLAYTYNVYEIMRPESVAAQSEARAVLIEAHAYVTEIDRPTVLFMPTPWWTGQVFEQIVLLQGFFYRDPLDGQNLRSRLMPRTLLMGRSPIELETVEKTIRSGGVVIWAAPESFPPITDDYPVIGLLTENPQAVIRTWQHRALSEPRQIWIGYLP